MEKKTIRIELTVVTGVDNFTICEHIERYLLDSPLNNSEHKLEINEVKVIRHDNETNVSSDH